MSLIKPQRYRLIPGTPAFAGQDASVVCPPTAPVLPPPPGGQRPPGTLDEFLFTSAGISPEEFARRVGVIRDSLIAKPSAYNDATDSMYYVTRLVSVGPAFFRTYEWWHIRPGVFTTFFTQPRILYGSATTFTTVRQSGWARQRNARCVETLTLHSAWRYAGPTLNLGAWETNATLYTLDTANAPFNPSTAFARSDRI